MSATDVMLANGLVMLGLAASIYLTGRRRRRREAEGAARGLEAMQAANEVHNKRTDALLGRGREGGT